MCIFKGDASCSKLSPCGLGFAFGIVKGLYLMLMAWVGWLFGYGVPMIEHIGSFYHSYSASLYGGLLGGAGGFICGFIAGYFVAVFYNLCLSCCKRKDNGSAK